MEKILQGNFFHEFFKKFLKPCYCTPENNDRQIAGRLGAGFGRVRRYYFDTSEILAEVLFTPAFAKIDSAVMRGLCFFPVRLVTFLPSAGLVVYFM